MTTKKYSAVIFDMDGTVLNTLDDLTDALNHALKETGHDHAYTTADVRNFFGSGVTVAITRALASSRDLRPMMNSKPSVSLATRFTPQIDLQEVSRIQDLYKPYYAAHCSVKTGEYDASTPWSAASVNRVSRSPSYRISPIRPYKTWLPTISRTSLTRSSANSLRSAANRHRTWSKKHSPTSALHQTRPYTSATRKSISRRPTIPPRLHQCYLGLRPAEFLKSHGASILVDRPADIAAVVLGD